MPSLAPSPMLSRSSTIACNSGSNIRACICGSVAAKVRLNVGLRYWSRSGMPALGTAMTPMLYGPPPRSPLSRRIEGAMVPRREGIIGDLASLLQQCGRSLERQTGVLLVVLRGGGRGIRTPGTVSRTAVFKTARFNRSVIPPFTLSDSLYGSLHRNALLVTKDSLHIHRIKETIAPDRGEHSTMGRYQKGYVYQAFGAWHVRYYVTELVDGKPVRKQKSSKLCNKD